jgi:hypothetical protein
MTSFGDKRVGFTLTLLFFKKLFCIFAIR